MNFTSDFSRRSAARAARRRGTLAVLATLTLVLLALPSHRLLAQDSTSAGATPVSLATAIRLAQQNSPLTVQARGAERTSQAAARSAFGAFIPSITASAGAVRRFTGTGTTTRINPNGERVTVQGGGFTYNNAFSLNAQLLNFNQFPNLRAARADVNATRENTVVQSFAAALSVQQQFFNALAARESEDAARAQLAQAEQQLAVARRRVVAGAAIASDSLLATTQVLNARLALSTAQNARRDANATLTRLVGSPTPVAAAINDPAVTTMATVPLDSAALAAAAEAGPLVTAASATRRAADARRQAARAAYLPTLNASYSRGGSGTGQFGFGSDPFLYSGQLNLSLSYPIFNQFSREEQVARASVNADNAAVALRDARLQARELTVRYLGALQLGREQIALQTAAVAAATEGLRVQQQRYELGLSLIVDVLTAQTTLNQARANLIAARNTVRLATAQIESLLGRPLASITNNTDGAVR